MLLAPPWAPGATVAALAVVALLGRLGWHSRRLLGVDAWAAEVLSVHTYQQWRLATGLAGGLRALAVVGAVAVAALAWIALRRWSAVTLALVAPVATLGAEKLLKPLVAHRVPDSTAFRYPSGHVAVLTAVALCLVLIVRSMRARPATLRIAVCSTSLLVLLMAWARLVETAHVLSDVVGGLSTGVAVTLGAALLLDRRSVRGGLLELHPLGLGKAGEQRADREHWQRDHGRRDQEVVQGGDQDAE
jgi:membrane-associated phospholipid phosphatase